MTQDAGSMLAEIMQILKPMKDKIEFAFCNGKVKKPDNVEHNPIDHVMVTCDQKSRERRIEVEECGNDESTESGGRHVARKNEHEDYRAI